MPSNPNLQPLQNQPGAAQPPGAKLSGGQVVIGIICLLFLIGLVSSMFGTTPGSDSYCTNAKAKADSGYDVQKYFKDGCQ
jgi:hypothetical protein